MKKILFLLLVLSASTIIGQTKNKKVNTATIQTSAVCDMCEDLIVNKTLSYEKGVKYAEMNVETGELLVRYKNNKTSIEHLRNIISQLGYAADSIKADSTAYENLHFCCKAP